MNDNLHIELPTKFTVNHQRLILKYLASGRRALGLSDWKLILEGFDLLHQTRVNSGGNVQTFKQIYADHVEQPFADPFINELLLLEEVSREQQALRARYARRIVKWLMHS